MIVTMYVVVLSTSIVMVSAWSGYSIGVTVGGIVGGADLSANGCWCYVLGVEVGVAAVANESRVTVVMLVAAIVIGDAAGRRSLCYEHLT